MKSEVYGEKVRPLEQSEELEFFPLDVNGTTKVVYQEIVDNPPFWFNLISPKIF